MQKLKPKECPWELQRLVTIHSQPLLLMLLEPEPLYAPLFGISGVLCGQGIKRKLGIRLFLLQGEAKNLNTTCEAPCDQVHHVFILDHSFCEVS